MTISYNIPTGTVALDVTPAELHDMAADAIENASKLFTAVKDKVQQEIAKT